MEGIGEDYFPCVPTPECKYWGKNPDGCGIGRTFETEHHYYQVDALTSLRRIFRNLPRNKATACRVIHEQLLDPYPREYPSDEEMKQEIIDADLSGEVCLSNNKRRIIYGTTKH